MRRRSKYGAKPTEVDGIRFHSKAEARRYEVLKLMLRSGEIDNLELQPSFDLHVKGIKIGRYIADFRYIDTRTGETVIEDVKGVRTDFYRWKKKHMKAEHGIDIYETK